MLKVTLAFVVFWVALLLWAAEHDRLKIAVVCIAIQACIGIVSAIATWDNADLRRGEERRRLWVEGVRADDSASADDDDDPYRNAWAER